MFIRLMGLRRQVAWLADEVPQLRNPQALSVNRWNVYGTAGAVPALNLGGFLSQQFFVKAAVVLL